jgi:hypothetical protein
MEKTCRVLVPGPREVVSRYGIRARRKEGRWWMVDDLALEGDQGSVIRGVWGIELEMWV